MTLLSVNGLTVTQPTKTLFEGATFGIAAHDKVAVIGPNGCGKSTLLKMISQIYEEPNNAIVSKRGLRITFLSQHVTFNPDDTIRDHIYNSSNEASSAIKEYQDCLELLNNQSSEEVDTRFSIATEQMESTGAWAYEDRVNSILRELNINDLSQKMSQLSGGMIKKIAFAKLFFEEMDLLILDEPTNHLDLATIEWLEGMLEKQRSAILMVTHDRYFLDKICTHILEIDQEKVFSYKGNYVTYLEQQELRYHDQAKRESSIKSVLRVELAWLRRGPRGRGTKQRARKGRIEAIQNRDRQQAKSELALNINERRM